jgi:hypothetical protein
VLFEDPPEAIESIPGGPGDVVTDPYGFWKEL